MSAEEGKRKYFLSWYFETNLLWRILIGLALGAAVGIGLAIAGNITLSTNFTHYTSFFGDIFIRLLKMIMVPVVFFSMIVGAASITPAHLGKIGVKILAFYIITSFLAVILGLALANLIRPGVGLHVHGSHAVQLAIQEVPPLSQVLLNIIPTNPVESIANGDILPIIFFSILFGIGISVLKNSAVVKTAKAADILYQLCAAAAETMYKIVAGIMQYAPIGVFVLIANVFASEGPGVVGHLIMVTIAVYIGLILHLIVCYGGSLGMFGLGLVNFLLRANQPMITAFVTRTSSGTLPVTLRVTEERLGVPRAIASFSLPLGATINMDGTAIYLGVCAMFIAYSVDMPLSFAQQTAVVITATLASIGTAGVPGAGALMLLMVMDSIGLPVVAGTNVAAAYAMVLGIDAILDMGRTGLNVTGDMVGTVIVAKIERSLDMSAWR